MECAPAGVLLADAAGTVKYCNPAAFSVLAGAGAQTRSPVGRPVDEVLAALAAAAATRRPLPSGGSVWYLPDDGPSLRDARFAAEVGDALAGTLNLRRTLVRVVDLAVPTLGRWAAVTFWDQDRIRQVSRGLAAGGDDPPSR